MEEYALSTKQLGVNLVLQTLVWISINPRFLFIGTGKEANVRVETRGTPKPETNHLLSQCTKVRDTHALAVSHLVTPATVAL